MRFKFLVYGLFLWASAQTVLVTKTLYDNLVGGWGNMAGLQAIHTSWLAFTFFDTGCTSA
jgi:hypothetical protein